MSATDDELLAAELAWGLLAPAERDAAETRAGRDPAFAAAVERWRVHALALAGAGEPPPATVWARTAAALPANDPAPRRARRWLTAAGLVAAGAAGVALLRPTPPAPVSVVAAHPFVALLTAPDRRATLAVSIAAGGHGLATVPGGLDLPGHAAELWVIPAGGAARSLGVVAARPTWRAVAAPLAATLRPGATLAVSIEPVGGSPTGKPTGPVILTATISAT